MLCVCVSVHKGDLENIIVHNVMCTSPSSKQSKFLMLPISGEHFLTDIISFLICITWYVHHLTFPEWLAKNMPNLPDYNFGTIKSRKAKSLLAICWPLLLLAHKATKLGIRVMTYEYILTCHACPNTLMPTWIHTSIYVMLRSKYIHSTSRM